MKSLNTHLQPLHGKVKTKCFQVANVTLRCKNYSQVASLLTDCTIVIFFYVMYYIFFNLLLCAFFNVFTLTCLVKQRQK